MSNKNPINQKDKWLNGWLGRDISPEVLEMLKELMGQYYIISKKQALIYIRKYASQEYLLQDKTDNLAHDIALRVLFITSLNKYSGKYKDEGKVESYIRAVIQKQVLNFLRIKNYLHLNLEMLSSDEEKEINESNLVKQFLDDCHDEIMTTGASHAIRNVELFYTQKEYNKTIEELAEKENTTIGGIKSRLRLAREILFDCVEKKKLNDNSFF